MSDTSLPLVTRAATKDRAAIEELLVMHLPGLEGWLRLRMGELLRARETPEDLVQSIAREVLSDLSSFEWRGESAFRHWLYVRAQQKLIDKARFVSAARRNPAREEALPAADASRAPLAAAAFVTPSGVVQSQEELARIERAFAELAPDYQEAISLQRLCGMDYRSIGERMNRSEGAVRNLVYRGLSKLAIRLGELRRLAARDPGPRSD